MSSSSEAASTSLLCKGLVESSLDYQKQFENSLLKAKGSALVALIVVSVMYNIVNRNKTNSKTLLSSQTGKVRVFAESVCTAVFGVISALFVIVVRNGWTQIFTLATLQTVLVVALILSLFCYAQEASGLNRYLAEKDTRSKSGLYYELDENGHEPEEPTYINDPFIASAGYVMISGLALVVVVHCINMIRVTKCGYDSGLHDLSATKFYYSLGFSNPALTFATELAIVGLLNAIPPFVSPSIRGEKITGKSSAFAAFTLVIASCLQYMLQYSGLFHDSTKT